MLAKILKGNRNFIPVVIFILFGVGFLLLNTPIIDVPHKIISSLIILSVGIHAGLIINKFPYFKENFYFTFIVAMQLLFITCCFENINFFAGFLMLTVVFIQMLLTWQKEIYVLNGFDSGFFTSIAIVFFPPFWIFALFLIISFVIKGKTEIRSLILTFLGLVAFGILAFEIIAVWDLWHLKDWFFQRLYFNFFEWKNAYYFLLPLLIPPILGLVDYFRNINRQSANKKLVYFDAMLFAIYALICIILYGGNDQNFLLLLVIPAALFTSNLLTYNNIYWQKEVILSGIVVCLLLFKFHHLIQLPEIFDQVTF